MEVRTTFRGTAVSRKGLGAALMALIVAVGALFAISLASAGSARPAATTAPSQMFIVGQLGEHAKTSGSPALIDRESGQPVSDSNSAANDHGLLP
jgi:hypothetical protein